MIRLTEEDYNELRAHGEEAYPHECCGVLLGESEPGVANRVSLIVRAGNTRTDSAHNRYNISPQELVKIQRQARGLGFDIVGFYHSHPDHPAQWSQTDFAEAHWMGCSYVITSVEQGKAVLTNSFLLTGTSEENKAFQKEEVVVERSTLDYWQGKRRSMKIHIPTPLRTYTGGKETVEVEGTNVATTLQQLAKDFPALRNHLFTEEGKLRSFVNVYLNDDDVRYLPNKEETVASENDELTIIPSIAGGGCCCCK